MNTIRNVKEIKEPRGVKTGKVKKAGVKRSPKSEDWKFDCFGSSNSVFCSQINCLIRDDCVLFGMVS
ncbi:MAG: SAP domain-containing protein [Nitrospirota bacterium]